MHRCLTVLTCWLAATLSLTAQDNATFFNGKDLTGWEGLSKYWSVKDGALVGSSQPDGLKFNTFLCSKSPYKNFELKFKVKLEGQGANSGVQVRSEMVDKEKWVVWGPQCDMGEGWWGSLFGEHFGGAKKGDHSFIKPADKEAVNKVLKKDDFNEYGIRCEGKKVKLTVNGLVTVDGEFPVLPESGIIAFQLHGGAPMTVTYKDIQFKALP